MGPAALMAIISTLGKIGGAAVGAKQSGANAQDQKLSSLMNYLGQMNQFGATSLPKPEGY